MKKLFLFPLIIISVNSHSQSFPLWGMTSAGGYGLGNIFGFIPGDTTIQVQYNFPGVSGINPGFTQLTEFSNSKLYGLTVSGGFGNDGIIFEYDLLKDSCIKKFDFNFNNGYFPQGSLLKASNGKLYGTTQGGGTKDYGVLFEYDPTTSTFLKKIDFNGTNGGNPIGSLIQIPSGKLYGTANIGANFDGVLFEYDISTNSYIKKYDFNGPVDGATPVGNLVMASSGKLYGMTNTGGSQGRGSIFEYDPASNLFIKKVDFDTSSGCSPYGSLMLASNGKMYGMTTKGGAKDKGSLFEYVPGQNTITKKLSFWGISNGSSPHGSLIEGSNNKLYGMTRKGGIYDYGIVFEYDILTDTIIRKKDFSGLGNGSYSMGTFLKTSSGKLLGMTSYGGESNSGTIIEYEPISDTVIKKFDFFWNKDGYNPLGSLFQASNGKLYGMTFNGGVNNDGVLFEFNPATKTYTAKWLFRSFMDGKNPRGSLVQGNNGKLYGSIFDNDLGLLIEYDLNLDTLNVIYNYFFRSDGCNPLGALIQASNGKLYGTTSAGGIIDCGTLFEYDLSTNVYTKKIDFNLTIGRYPTGTLLQAKNGKMYGMTNMSGAFGTGTLFEYDPTTDSILVKVDFRDTLGYGPQGSLIQASNGKLYGMTSNGGLTDMGVLFEYDLLTNNYMVKYNFDSINGIHPLGSLIQASDSNLYGMTSEGGKYGKGVVFQYFILNSGYKKIADFNEKNGASPQFSDLIEVKGVVGSINENSMANKEIIVFPNPFNDWVTVKTEKIPEFIAIYTITGKLLTQLMPLTNRVTVNLSGYSPGLYFIKATIGNKQLVSKLIKH